MPRGDRSVSFSAWFKVLLNIHSRGSSVRRWATHWRLPHTQCNFFGGSAGRFQRPVRSPRAQRRARRPLDVPDTATCPWLNFRRMPSLKNKEKRDPRMQRTHVGLCGTDGHLWTRYGKSGGRHFETGLSNGELQYLLTRSTLPTPFPSLRCFSNTDLSNIDRPRTRLSSSACPNPDDRKRTIFVSVSLV